MQLVSVVLLVATAAAATAATATAATGAAADADEARHSTRTSTATNELEELSAQLALEKATVIAQGDTIASLTDAVARLTAQVAALNPTQSQTPPRGPGAAAAAADPIVSDPKIQSLAPGDEPPPAGAAPGAQEQRRADTGFLAPSRRLPAYPTSSSSDASGHLVVKALPLPTLVEGYVRQ